MKRIPGPIFGKIDSILQQKPIGTFWARRTYIPPFAGCGDHHVSRNIKSSFDFYFRIG
jgi:hypothetical protein